MDERERVARIRRPARADAVAVSLALARRVLAVATGLAPGELVLSRTCEHCGDPTHGRPRLVPELVNLSVSRSDRHAAVAVAFAPVGVDVEDAGRSVSADVLAPVLAPDERAWLARRGADAALGLWVQKEAVGKAMGLGIVEAERFSVVTNGELAGWRAVLDPAGHRWSVRLVDAPDAVVAVAVAGSPRRIHSVESVSAHLLQQAGFWRALDRDGI